MLDRVPDVAHDGQGQGYARLNAPEVVAPPNPSIVSDPKQLTVDTAGGPG
jgi:hypothetical protein